MANIHSGPQLGTKLDCTIADVRELDLTDEYYSYLSMLLARDNVRYYSQMRFSQNVPTTKENDP